MRTFLLFGPLVASALLGCGGSTLHSANAPVVGETVQFELTSNTGEFVEVPLKNERTTVLVFFSPQCGPCKTALPAIFSRRDALAAKGAKIVLVGSLADDEPSDVGAEALKRWGVDQPFLVDQGGDIARKYGVTSPPATYVLDKAGTVKWVAPPSARPDDLVQVVP